MRETSLGRETSYAHRYRLEHVAAAACPAIAATSTGGRRGAYHHVIQPIIPADPRRGEPTHLPEGRRATTPALTGLAVSDKFEPGIFAAIFEALDASSRPLVGPAVPRLLVIPIRADDGSVAGGFWGCTVFQWLHVQMLFVPEKLRGLGVGSALMAAAEAAARDRGCRGIHLDTFSFQAAPFYRKLGFSLFGVLEDFPPGYSRLFLRKRFDAAFGDNDPPVWSAPDAGSPKR